MNAKTTSKTSKPVKTSKLDEIRASIEQLEDPNGALGVCEIIQTVVKANPNARRKELKEVLVGDLGLNPGTVHRQIQEARKTN